VISHDRFFMDKITDHLFIFEGDGVVKDFWWTYSEYKDGKEDEKWKNKTTASPSSDKDDVVCSEEDQDSSKKKLSYSEKRELDQLTRDIHVLEKERDEINRIFEQKDVAYDDIKDLSDALWVILRQLEQKEYRWFELSSRE
jgi:ATP-binding cassette subfamily F protein uup